MPEARAARFVRRPFLSLSFALNYHFFGLDPDAFQFVNLAIHLLATLTLYGVVRRSWQVYEGQKYPDDGGVMIGFAVALPWLVHPLQTEAVTYLVQRAESLMGLLLLFSLYCLIRGALSSRNPSWWYGAAVFTCSLGMGTKESMVVAPLLLLLYDYVFLSGDISSALTRRRWFYLAIFSTWLILLALIALTAEDAARDFQAGMTLPLPAGTAASDPPLPTARHLARSIVLVCQYQGIRRISWRDSSMESYRSRMLDHLSHSSFGMDAPPEATLGISRCRFLSLTGANIERCCDQ